MLEVKQQLCCLCFSLANLGGRWQLASLSIVFVRSSAVLASCGILLKE